MSNYIPFPMYADDVPVDLSFIFEKEKPAGKHGFLKAAGDRFQFEDGTVGRFWGTNFNGGANFPEFSYSEKIAKRLAKIGINIVRFHQLDSEWNTPNIFCFTKGPLCDNTTNLDPESIKRLDYLIYCLKNEGIYCYLDIFTYRKFKSGDGVENAHLIGDAAKPYAYYNRRMIELQKKLAYDLWTHINPYTGLAYKDDPVFVMCEVVNESDLFSWPLNVEPYTNEFRTLFRTWLDEKGISQDAETCDVNNMKDSVLIQFKTELQERYYLEMIGFMREIGVKIPITGTNWTINGACIKSQLVTDFTDSHAYYYDWKWREYEKFCMNRAITATDDCGIGGLAMMRVFGKPFFVSEWDVPWPNEYRAEGPLHFAAVGALQGWSGFTIHTYSYGTRLDDMKILGKEISSSLIGNVPYREGIFSTWNDPAKFGLFYHSALITRRADVSPAENKINIKIGDYTSFSPLNSSAFTASAEISQIASCFDDEKDSVSEKTPLLDLESCAVRSDNNQLYRNWKKITVQLTLK